MLSSHSTSWLQKKISALKVELTHLEMQLTETEKSTQTRLKQPVKGEKLDKRRMQREQGQISRAWRCLGETSPTLLGKRLSISRQRADQLIHQERHRAREILNAALILGTVIKPLACIKCGDKEDLLEAHHPDYSHPLIVEWLCEACHIATRKGERRTSYKKGRMSLAPKAG